MLPVTVFSDFTCPYSYVTETALRELELDGRISVSYRAFELYPAPSLAIAPNREADWEGTVRQRADDLGLELRNPGFRPRTRKAHEAARFAVQRGVGSAMREAIFSAYWGHELDIGRIDVLQGLIAALEVDPVDLKIVLDIDGFRDEVIADEQLANRLRIAAVPVLFLGTGPGARILVGAQSRAALDAAIGGG